MRTKVAVASCLVGVCALLCSDGWARSETDVEGSRDHDLLSRFPDSIIEEFHHSEFDEYVLLTGVVGPDCVPSASRDIEGEVTRIQYSFPESSSTLEVYRSYQAALESAGFEVMFAGSKQELGIDFARCFVEEINPVELMGEMSGEEPRYMCGVLRGGTGDTYVSLLVNLDFSTPRAQLDVIESEPMTAGQVTVNAAAIESSIARSGHAAIYNISFESGQASIGDGSGPAMLEIARAMEGDPNLSLYVVGHTDNIGALEFNLELSRRRAEAVVTALVSEYGVDPARRMGRGVGPLAPVSSNATEDGRALNRRVELVEQ